MSNDVTAAFFAMRTKQRTNLMKAFGESEATQTVVEKSENDDLFKALRSNNPFDREAAEEQLMKSNTLNEIEKSDIMEAISYSSEFGFEKTGKEIKENINSKILPKKRAAYEAKKGEIDKLLADCGDAPTKDICGWCKRGMDFELGYKSYDWSETYYHTADDYHDCVCDAVPITGGKEVKKNLPCSAEQAETRQKYNRAVDILCDIMVDIKTCELLVNNIGDSQKIKLTPRQAIVFGFE